MSISARCAKGAHARFRYSLCTTDLAASAAIRGGFLNSGAQAEDAISDRFGSCRAAAGICTGHPKGHARSGPDFLRCASTTTLLCGLAYILAGFPPQLGKHSLAGDRFEIGRA